MVEEEPQESSLTFLLPTLTAQQRHGDEFRGHLAQGDKMDVTDQAYVLPVLCLVFAGLMDAVWQVCGVDVCTVCMWVYSMCVCIVNVGVFYVRIHGECGCIPCVYTW